MGTHRARVLLPVVSFRPCRRLDGNLHDHLGGSPFTTTGGIYELNLKPSIHGRHETCEGNASALSTDDYMTYQWIMDGMDIPGATAQSHVPTQNGTYAVRVTDDRGCAGTSAGWNFSLLPPPIPTITGPDAGCPISGVVLRTQSYASYQWNLDGTPIPGSTSQVHTATQSGMYTVTVRNSTGCSGLSGGKTVTIYEVPGPPVITQITDVDACIQSGIVITFTNGSGATSHSLVRDGAVVAADIANPCAYNPGDGTTHSYSIRAVNVLCTTDSPAQPFPDEASAPGAVQIIQILDDDPCAQSGITIFFSGGAGAVRFDLLRDGVLVASDISSPVQVNPKNRADHTYVIRAVGESCLTDSPPQVFADAKNTPDPTIPPPYSNVCPETTVTLSTEAGMSAYQWRFKGRDIPGATGQTYTATVSGKYSVAVVTVDGCTGESAEHHVKVVFCRDSAVSPTGCIYPLRVVKDAGSPTGTYMYFQMIEGATGYNLYAGDIGSWYTHGTTLERRVCDAVVTDLNTGEMQASLPLNPWDSYYLVTAFDSAYEGPSGFDSSGSEIPNLYSTCPP